MKKRCDMGANTKAVKLTSKAEKLFQEVVQAVQDMVDELHATPSPTREFALMLTKLEEAEMWGQRAFETLGYESEDGDEGEDGDESEDGDEGEDEDGDEETAEDDG